ncbi:kinase-like domain-containing protein [Annulohypoxylon moriforme]|nr:kinase-like domain-containing protein [Annulohypoxylon moriforme]
MIDVEKTFFYIGEWDHENDGDEEYSGLVTTSILLSDRRHEIFVTAPAALSTDEAARNNTMFKKLYKILPSLSPEAILIRIDAEGLLEEVTSNPEELDYLRERSRIQTLADMPKPLLSDTSFSSWPTLQHEQLIELDRFTPNVDLVKLADQTDASMVVKYIFDDQHMRLIWTEINILKEMQPHPSILPLDHLVLGDKGHIIGMTTKFIRGGSLGSRKDRTIKLKWLKQLTEVLDFLHLDQGIIHGDMGLNNILIDEESDRLLLCDFERSRKISESGMEEELWLVVWSLYSLVTQDYEAMTTRFWEMWEKHGKGDLDSEVLERMPTWPVKAKLDCDLKEFREHLTEWLEKRRETLDNTEAKNQILMEWKDKQYSPNYPYYTQIPLDPVMLKDRLSNAVEVDWERLPYEEAYPDKVPKKEEHKPNLTARQQRMLEPFLETTGKDEIEEPSVSVEQEPHEKRKTPSPVEDQPPSKKSKTSKVENEEEKRKSKDKKGKGKEKEKKKGKGKKKGK